MIPLHLIIFSLVMGGVLGYKIGESYVKKHSSIHSHEQTIERLITLRRNHFIIFCIFTLFIITASAIELWRILNSYIIGAILIVPIISMGESIGFIIGVDNYFIKLQDTKKSKLNNS
jgi:hypothetical protein